MLADSEGHNKHYEGVATCSPNVESVVNNCDYSICLDVVIMPDGQRINLNDFRLHH